MGHYSFNSFIKDAGKITKPIHKDIVSVANGADRDFNKVIDTQASVIDNAVDKGSSAISSLAMPMMIAGACVALYLITKK